MPLKLCSNLVQTLAANLWVLAIVAAPLALSGCINSAGPILGDARAILGDRIQVHFFTPTNKDGGRDHSTATFEWNGSRYLPLGSAAGNWSDFTVHPYEGRDFIVQTSQQRGARSTEYALARRLSEGLYLVMPISEEDADEPTRERFCTKTQDSPCRIATPEQLFVFARATAAKDEESGGIAVIVPSAQR
jgi:hypothetical protein